ncbi:unnamed protein product [Spirodela intermedia]|uniref:Uncharacterized protein n=1 Tax=Spirodela intermedia TaxID=51605 RepID=A0A7I8IWJ5_SPIIN|nr:unnamed protein product [Spirodela intermedia]CAA6661380.1 unnamed protein product [Spirodela intermedia]
MEASAAAAAGRLALLGCSAAGRHLRRRGFTSAAPRGVPPRLLLFSSLSFKPRWVGGAAAAKANSLASSSSLNAEGFFHAWELPPGEGVGGPRSGAAFDEGAVWTAVLLGWLGAEHKHLRRYAEMYKERGIRTVSFVVPVGELVLDLGKGMEGRIARLATELAAWAEGGEADGRERKLLFHTFSNTGWFTYGAILESLRSRSDVLEKIRGCVVDSGADPEINPQVWAAGFSAAYSRSAVYGECIGGDAQAAVRQGLSELIVLSILEKFFSLVLRLPDVNQRLSKIISILSKDQPPCPQLYLYSSADRVIPARSVHAHDFRVSPHVDHLRAFPLIYSAKLYDFLKNCAARRL